MLAIECMTCGRRAGVSSPPCEDCRQSFLSHELAVMIMTARSNEEIIGVYTRDPDTNEWVKEVV